ncbi:protein transport protein Sec31A isoform X2 [Adelges cooleyi]|uniref:protein transport protein Sec31A isoform X2 n=1 Tax=Adelges cooleyi TaxID=133065 RepID=UPI00217FDD07|nr:protein transport protein Sec31A isoform X2 [Adelges cooleyi]
MKIKQIQSTVVSAWSPKPHQSLTIAMGTAAQQLDASFNTSSKLELYTVQSNDLILNSSISTDCRFHKLAWGGYESFKEWSSGVIAGGCDNGVIRLYDASKLASDVNSLVAKSDRHIGSVKALDFNSFQSNLLASGASESEIFIWDLFNMSTPMTPGSKSDILEDVIDLAWNKEVQHILGSLFHKHAVVWDLRKNEPIIKLTDTDNSKFRWKSMSWNPNIATQLCIASEDDQYPVIQLWDLRYASSPVKNLIGHQKGVLSIAWCSNDANLLISCGKDNRVCLWNPSSETEENLLICHLEHDYQWNFEVNWCPKDPLLLETSSFDGYTTIYSLSDLQKHKTIQNYQEHSNVTPSLKNAPKWLRRNSGASFAFGGNLVSFDGPLKTVQINNTITEPDLVVWSDNLRKTLQDESYELFCKQKSEITPDNALKQVWDFLEAMFHEKPKEAQLKILGYSAENAIDVATQFCSKKNVNTENQHELNKLENDLSTSNLQKNVDDSTVYNFKNINLQTTGNNLLQNSICQLLLVGNTSMAADILFDNGKTVEALLLAFTADPQTLSRLQNKYFKSTEGASAALLYSIVTDDWQNLVENCNLSSWKEVMAALLTYTNGPNFVSNIEKLGCRLAVDSNYSQYAKLCFVCSGNIESLIDYTNNIESVDKLQECVEMTILLYKSLLSNKSHFEAGCNFGQLIVKYCENLVSQGNLNGALEFLELANSDAAKALKEQIFKALGKMPIKDYTNQIPQKRDSIGIQDLRKYSISSATSTVTPEPPFPSYPKKMIQEPDTYLNYKQPILNYQSVPPQPLYSSNNSQQPNYNNTTTMMPPQLGNALYNQTSVQPNAVPLTPPLNSESNRSITPSSLKSGKPKYLVDPSVKGNNTYGVYNNNSVGTTHPINNYNQPSNHLNNMNNQLRPLTNYNNQLNQPITFNQPLDQSHNFTDPLSHPIQPNNFNPPLVQSNHINQSSIMQPMFQPVQNPLHNYSQRAIPPSPSFNQPSLNQPTVYNSGVSSVEPHYPSVSNNYVKKQTPAGWNDPPMLSSSQKKPQTPVPSAPITHPMYTNNPPQIQEIGTYIPLRGDLNGQNNTTEISQGIEATPRQPIPQEHIRIKLILDGIQSRLLELAPSPQNKRRVADVSKKLDVLYDSLCDNTLSAYTVQCLHSMLDLVLQQNYNEAFNIHTQLVSGPEFSKISTFIPSIKTLLQMTYQNNVNLEGL